MDPIYQTLKFIQMSSWFCVGKPPWVLFPLETGFIFLYPHQIVVVEFSALNAKDYKMVILKIASCSPSVVNFCVGALTFLC